MEYVIIFLLQIFGIAFNINLKIVHLDRQYPGVPLSQIKDIFWKQERVMFFGSALIIMFHLLCHVIIDLYAPEIRNVKVPIFIVDWSVPYIIVSFIIALLLGYFGQALIYKLFGKAEKILKDKIK